MTLCQRPLVEVTHEAISVLLREIGAVNMVRLLNQYTARYSNYSEERRRL